jgi:uncharacterized repeat protein (TIGR03803 family)
VGVAYRLDLTTSGPTRTLLHSFTEQDGDMRRPSPLPGSAGEIFGTINSSLVSKIYRLDFTGTGWGYTDLHVFAQDEGKQLSSPLVQGPDGTLYGAASGGGTGNTGTVYRINPDGTGFTILHRFVDPGEGRWPSALALGQGGLYGTLSRGGAFEQGAIFRMATDGSGFDILHAFEGSGTWSMHSVPLIGSDGSLYGSSATDGQCRVYRIQPDGSGFGVLHDFGTRVCLGPLVQGPDGRLIGLTGQGIPSVPYRLASDGSSFEELTGSVATGGGITRGADGTVYGFTESTNDRSEGFVWQLTPGAAAAELLYSFRSAAGSIPGPGLVRGSDDALYGATQYGGANGLGVLFRVAPSDLSPYSVLRDLDALTGTSVGGLLPTPDAGLLGTAWSGGTAGQGTVFQVGLDGSGFQVVHNLTPSSAIGRASLTRAGDGGLFGAACYGGPWNGGGVLQVPLDAPPASIHDFHPSSDGTCPRQLLAASDGLIYGTTDSKSVFRLGPGGEAFETVANLWYAYWLEAGPLAEGEDGRLYAAARGSNGEGQIVGIDPVSRTVTWTRDLDGSEGTYPRALLRGADGVLYGVAGSGGTDGVGTIYRLGTTSLSVLHHFGRNDGSLPRGPLVQGADGALYGTTGGGGPEGGGVIFRLELPLALAVHGRAAVEGSPAVFRVALSRPAPTPVTVRWTTQDGTATAPADYTAAAGVLTFPTGATEAIVEVEVHDDALDEADEDLGLLLAEAQGAEIFEAAARASVLDDDPIPVLNLEGRVVAETDATQQVPLTLRLSAPSGRPVTVNYATRNGSAQASSDYVAAAGSLSLAPGQVTQSVVVGVLGDLQPEASESFHVDLSSATNAVISADEATLTVRDDDPTSGDFSGDGSADLAVYRGGAWLFADPLSGGPPSGVFTGQPAPGCRPAPLDSDGDGRLEMSQVCADRWYFYRPDGSLLTSFSTGALGDTPVPADYDGDGLDDVTVFRHGAWLTFAPSTGALLSTVWTGEPANGLGVAAVPYPGDFDGDGRADRTIYSGGAWHSYHPDGSYRAGVWTGSVPGDLPVGGDYDGDGIDDLVVWRGGAWLAFDRDTGAFRADASVWTGAPPHLSGGTPLPVPLDVDGDGRLDRGVWSGGPWHLFEPGGGYRIGVWFGTVAGDLPISRRPSGW